MPFGWKDSQQTSQNLRMCKIIKKKKLPANFGALRLTADFDLLEKSSLFLSSSSEPKKLFKTSSYVFFLHFIQVSSMGELPLKKNNKNTSI